MTCFAFLQVAEVPGQVGVLSGWFDWITREHVAWTALVIGLVWTVAANIDLVERLLPVRARSWLGRQRKTNLARFVHFERPYAILNRDDAIGFGFRVFNGNRDRVTFRVDARLLHYGDRKIAPELVTVTAPPDGFPGGAHRELEVLISLRPPIAADVELDRAEGKLKSISLSEFVLVVLDDFGNVERITLPRSIRLWRSNTDWLAGRELGLHDADEKILRVVEGRSSL